jgi:YHS domain-containing protein
MTTPTRCAWCFCAVEHPQSELRDNFGYSYYFCSAMHRRAFMEDHHMTERDVAEIFARLREKSVMITNRR